MEESVNEPIHFVLIHGACLGAWCWYKVKTQLEMAGHQVTALDMAASGIDTRSIQDIRTMGEYTQPLLDFMKELPPDKKVVLVGHSLGGINISFAMEHYHEKVSVAVFLTAFMPDVVNPRLHVLEQFLARKSPAEWLDTTFTTQGSPTDPQAIIFYGPEFSKQKVSQRSPVEDLELSRALKRRGSTFINELSRDEKFTVEGYGSVKRAYIICEEDLGIQKDFQLWMIENYDATSSSTTTTDTFFIPDADHTPMFSKPKEVVKCLLEAAHRYR